MADTSRLRHRLLLAGLLPLLLALALCVKVAAMLVLDDRGRGTFAEGRFERAGAAFAANGRLNVFEPWVSPFGEATADYRLADYESARTLLEQALPLVPGEQECLVRINLALTLESLGDADLAGGHRDRAQARWREGIAVLDEGSCRSSEAAAPAARSVAARLARKLADRATETDEEPETTDPPQVEELERRNEEAQEQRRRNEEIREDDPPEPQPDEPAAPPSYSW